MPNVRGLYKKIIFVDLYKIVCYLFLGWIKFVSMFGFLRSFNIKKLVLSIKQSRPNVAVAIVVFFVFLFQAFSSRKDYGIDDKLRESVSNDIVQIFVQKDCPYCYKMKQYIESNDFSNYDIRFYDLGISKNSELLVQNVLLYKIDTKKSFGTPIIFYKNSYTMGFAGGEDGEKMFLDFLESRENIKD
ncbi:MAG: hypothetical protein LBG48_06180, partial [Rickettsiales bacterium]|nr:hypothetical protein [Rickettsiales bacterium]